MPVPVIGLRIRRAAAVALFLSVFLASACSPTGRSYGEFVQRSIQYRGVEYHYQVFLPAGPSKNRPVVMFLHGKGELGYDGKKPTLVGLGPYVRENRDTFPAIAIFPQAPDNTIWVGEVNEIALMALDSTLQEFQADADRVYLTGLSIGALGTWVLGIDHQERFAALVPVCNSLIAARPRTADSGLPDVQRVEDPLLPRVPQLRDMPIWIFHGGMDDIAPPLHARAMFNALKREGAANVRYTEFPRANHNCWDRAYADTPELWTWLFAQKRQ